MGLLLHILQRMNNFPVICEMLLDRELLLDRGSVSSFELCLRTDLFDELPQRELGCHGVDVILMQFHVHSICISFAGA